MVTDFTEPSLPTATNEYEVASAFAAHATFTSPLSFVTRYAVGAAAGATSDAEKLTTFDETPFASVANRPAVWYATPFADVAASTAEVPSQVVPVEVQRTTPFASTVYEDSASGAVAAVQVKVIPVEVNTDETTDGLAPTFVTAVLFGVPAVGEPAEA